MTRDEYYKAREILEEIGELDLYRSKFLNILPYRLMMKVDQVY